MKAFPSCPPAPGFWGFVTCVFRCFFAIESSVFPEKEQPDFNTNKIAQAGACAGILEKSPRLRSEQFSV